MRFEVLGPLRVTEGGRELLLGTRDQQRLLALLVASPEGLSADRLVDELWGEAPPASAHHLVQVYVSRLRSVFGLVDPRPRLVREGHRYRLRLGPHELDATDLVDAAGVLHDEVEADPVAARSALVSVERLWRGAPYEGLADESPLLRDEAARLERHHLQIVTDRLAADLALGRHEEVLVELERLTAEHPYDESLWCHRMLALYRSGRAAEAVQVAKALRALLADELGVEPSPQAEELEARIVERDPALQWQAPPRTNLPVPVTSFVGRAEELAAVAAVLGTARLVTLTGPAGIGKTRLAIEVAGRVRGGFPDGVWWVDLAGAVDPSMVAVEVARALGIAASAEVPVLDAITRTLTRRHALLVLDNCEHVLPVVAQLVAAVLGAAPHVRVLATSRAPLHLSAEVRWPVPGMAVVGLPGVADLPDAVRLFAERAAAVHPAAGVDVADVPVVADLCRRLDGIPLAIEMAASRAGLLSPPELVRGLDDRFRLLDDALIDRGDRHRTLEASLDWSYDQLAPAMQRVFDRLSVFVGPFDLEAVAAVACRSDGTLGAADAVAALVDVSMLAVERVLGRRRFRLLETVRDYATRHALAGGELEDARAAHAHHFLSLVVSAGEAVATPAFAGWAERIAASYPDVRQALAWSLVHEPRARTLEAAFGLFGYLYWSGDPREADRWSAAMLEGCEDVPPELTAGAHLCAAFAGDLLARPDEAARHSVEAIEMFRAAGRYHRLAVALWGRASIALQQGDLSTVVLSCREALAVSDEHGDRWTRATPLAVLAAGYQFGAVPLDEARAMAEEALALHRELGDLPGQAVLNWLPLIAAAQGDFDAAEGYARDSVAAAVGTRWEAPGRAMLSEVLAGRGDLDRSEAEASRAARLAFDAGLEIILRISVRNLALIATRRCDLPRAAVLIGASRRGMPSYGLDPAIYAEVEAACREGLGEGRAEALFAHGFSMPPELLLDLAAGSPTTRAP